MSAQLSFVASAGLLLARRPLNEPSNALASLIRTSATAIAATAPWVAWHGGSVGIWGVAANLIAVPWVGFGWWEAASFTGAVRTAATIRADSSAWRSVGRLLWLILSPRLRSAAPRSGR